LELLQFTLLQSLPQKDLVLLFERFIVTFSFIELPFKVRNVFLITFLSAILKARNLQLYSIANISFLQERHLIITQFLEWSAG